MKKYLKTVAFWAAALFVWELTFHLFVWRGLEPRFFSCVPFTFSLALFLASLSHIWPWGGANTATRTVLLAALAFVFCVQTVYYRIFGVLLSASLVHMGGEAIANFLDVTISGILHCSPLILIYLLPIPALLLLQRGKLLETKNVHYVIVVGGAVLSAVVFLLGVPGKNGDSSRSLVYHDMTGSIDRQAEYFGLLTAERLDLQRLGSDQTGIRTDVFDMTGDGEGRESNVMEELDLERLSKLGGTEQQQELTGYFSKLSGTAKNEYTGLFEGFNLIEICAESYWPYVLDPELTPALWRLTHEGIVFENFYCSFSSTTTNGEYAMNMGLLPDFNRQSFSMSMVNYLPFTMANRMKDLGVHPMGYHNNVASYYGRVNSHPNMGYDFKAIGRGLELTESYPYSDLEMMEKTLDDYIHDERFLGYYMTFSGHTPYNFEKNDIAIKNRAAVEGRDEPEEVLAYRACMMELEYAVEYLLDRLEQENLLDTTVIVLTGDHYPYPLSEESRRLIAGDAADSDPFWEYKNSFICWSGAIKEPIYVDSCCCTQDILPTLLNLFGIRYDSRLLTGTDALSDSTHMALLQDGSFRTSDMIYNSDTGEVTYLTPESELPDGLAQRLISAAKNQFSVAAAVLRCDYYGYAFTTLGIVENIDHDITAATFPDTVGKWYMEKVEALVRLGVAGGDGGNYLGDKPINRAEMSSLLGRRLNLPVPDVDEDESPYTDLVPGDWVWNAMLKLWAAGFFDEGETIGPKERITSEEAYVWAERTAEYLGLSDEDALAVRAMMEDAIARTGEQGLDTAYLTRGAAAAFVYDIGAYLPEEVAEP